MFYRQSHGLFVVVVVVVVVVVCFYLCMRACVCYCIVLSGIVCMRKTSKSHLS